MAENVRVAVRVRPFNSREKARNAALIISMSGKQTIIKNPEEPKAQPKKFAFDYSYWSHDGYKERADGYLEASKNNYADQQMVFQDLGLGVLDNAWKGYNCSLFAYGQTGSGKSYSMVGYGTNKGVVPVACDELFKRIEAARAKAQKGEEYQVQFSMLEIYNEQVRDLLNPASLKIKGGLKVRQHPNKGFYVEGLKIEAVNSYRDIDARMNEGTKNRTVASTNMNATSSRAHTIVAIYFAQKKLNEAKKSMTKTSIINLVDLAGSERAESTGATGDRLKEGSSINQSLSTLGNCIKALADASNGKKTAMVPFRDSSLTKLLKNALGGNSKTIMIAALSPADINYEETLSTLRFADRAKTIKTKAVVNESPTDKLIRELREENKRLMEMLKKGGGGGGGAGGNEEELAELKKQMDEELEKNKKELEEMQKSWEQKVKDLEAQRDADKVAEQEKKNKDEQRKVMPHFWNLNEDPSLTGMIAHFTQEGMTKIGSGKANPPADIQLNGLMIQPEHAVVENKNNQVFLIPCKGAKVTLNGNIIKEKKELHHNDRVLFGSSHLFVFHHPRDPELLKKDNKAQAEVKKPTFEEAQKEIAEQSGLSDLLGLDPNKSKDDLLLQEDLIQILPMVGECNAISEELNKKANFEVVLMAPYLLHGRKEGRTEVCVNYKNLQNGTEFVWDKNKFINRKYLMQEMYQNFADGDPQWDVSQENDPFWEDPNTEVLIGTVHVYLQSLSYLIEMEETLRISDFKGNEQGFMQVDIRPCTDKGKELSEDEFIDKPEQLVGKKINCMVKILNARGLNNRFRSSYCQYKLYLENNYAKCAEIDGINPDYNYQKMFSFSPVTKQLKDYLFNDALIVEVWGRQKIRNTQGGSLNTKELMVRERTGIQSGSTVADSEYRSAAEAAVYKRRLERAEGKLKKLQELVDNTRNKKQATLKVDEVEDCLNSGSVARFKATADIIKIIEKAKRENPEGVTSQACVIQ